MSAGNISLESAIRTCKVDTAYAEKIESDRFLNPENMVCPIWNGMDLTGRRVCADSFYTKNAGCNSAEDRVLVENNQRPQYMEYINLSARGIDGSIYGAGTESDYGNTAAWSITGKRHKDLAESASRIGNFGFNLNSYVQSSCSSYPYLQAMNQTHARHPVAPPGQQSGSTGATGAQMNQRRY